MKLKKIGVSFLVAIISFLFISNNVSALTSIDLTDSYDNSQIYSFDLPKDSIDKLIKKLDTFGYDYFFRLDRHPDGYLRNFGIYLIDKSDDIVFDSAISILDGYFALKHLNLHSYYYFSDCSTVDEFDNYVNNLTIDNFLSITTSDYYISLNDLTAVIYYSSKDIFLTDTNNLEYTIQVGEQIFTSGDNLMTVYEYKKFDDDEVVHVFPNIEPLEGFERYAVISTKCVYNNGRSCVSISEEPNYYLLYFNQNFTYRVSSSTTLWPDNVNLGDNYRLYNILNNEWNDFWLHDSTFFPFPKPLDLYDTKVVYSNFDIYYYDSDEIYFKSSIEQELEVEVPTTTDYTTTFNNKDFMLLIQNDFCQYANEENYIDYKVKISAKNAFNSDSSRSIYFQSMYADNNKFGKFIDDSINSMTGNSSIVFIDENTLEVNIRLSINDVEFACSTMPTSRLFKFDLGQLIDELKTKNFEIEIYSSAKGNKYTILPYEFYEKDIYFTSKTLYNSSVLFYLEPTNVTETTDNTIYLKNNVDYGVWNYQNSTSKRDRYFDLSMKYGLYTYKIEFDTENNKITGFKSIDDNLIFLDSAYTLKVHHPQSDFIIGDLIIQDNTEEVEIIKDSYENINDLLDTFNNYLTQIKKPIAPIMGLVGDLFNSMNSHIKGALISLLIILLLCALIKQMFKS